MMFRRCPFRPKKRLLFYIIALAVIGRITFCALSHLSQISSNRQLHFHWSSLIEFPQAIVTAIPRTRLINSENVIQPNQNTAAIKSRLSLSIFRNLEAMMKNVNGLIKKGLKINSMNISKNRFGDNIGNRRSTKQTQKITSLMNVTNHSCQPLYPDVVLYNRIFKTASTTMTSFLKNCSKELKYVITKESTEDWSNEKNSHPILRRIQTRAKQSERRHKRILAVAHFYFRIDTGIKAKHTYIKKLRRLKALGHWNVTLEQCLEKQYEGCKRNVMTRFFCGLMTFCKTGNKNALSQAKYNMLHYYSSIGVLEYLNTFVQVLHKRLPKFIINSPRGLPMKFVTSGVRKRRPVTDDVMAKITQVNQADIELYKYAKTLFLQQAKRCGISAKK